MMGRPKREVLATFTETTTPPDALASDHIICRVQHANGNSLFNVADASGNVLLVELPVQFRSTFWLKRGGFVIVDTKAFAERENKLGGQIANVVGDERAWRKMRYWPKEFPKRTTYEDSDGEEGKSTVGKMPPDSDNEDGFTPS